MSPMAPLSESAWDFVDGSNEILGFWEKPQLVGYYNALNALRLFAAAWLAEEGQYSIKAEVTGPKVEPAFGYPRPLEAGVRSIDADLKYPPSDGRWQVDAMTLAGGRPRCRRGHCLALGTDRGVHIESCSSPTGAEAIAFRGGQTNCAPVSLPPLAE